MISPFESTSLNRARSMGIEVDYIFIRNDGWTLGAPFHLAKDAENMWKGDWIEKRKIRSSDFGDGFELAGAL
jgi:hypothetical protein